MGLYAIRVSKNLSWIDQPQLFPALGEVDHISFSDDALGNQLDFDDIDPDTFGYYSEVNLVLNFSQVTLLAI